MGTKLGQRVRDCVTRTEGIAVARTEYLNGCVRICVQPQAEKPHEVVEKVEWVDEQQVQIIDAGVRDAMGLDDERPAAAVGGPQKSDAPI